MQRFLRQPLTILEGMVGVVVSLQGAGDLPAHPH